MSDYIVEMKAIEKSFNTNKVLKGVDFKLKRGSIHALLGENGTGKSTLMNILAGILSCDRGEICIDGEGKDKSISGAAFDQRISFIHQELALVNDLKVYENLFLGCELKNGFWLNKADMKKKAKEILKKMEIDLDLEANAGDLNTSYKQIIEIVRALMKDSGIIIMDEPTTALTDVEIAHIFEIMKSLKKQGVSFIFISHKLNEVVEICDSYTVMRDGLVVAAGEMTGEITENVLAKHMVGKELSSDDLYRERKLESTILELRNLTRDREFNKVNMYVKKGEIVGVTGLLGDGRSELFSTVYGCNDRYEGDILVNGKVEKVTSTSKAKTLGVSYVPRNRKENGIIKDLTVSENMVFSILPKLKKYGLLDLKKKKEIINKYVKELNIKVNDLNNLITSLSGGNQQKVVLAKALGSDPDIVILDNPTQGVDVGAKLEIYDIIMKLAQKGVSFVVLSSEAQEIMMLCDRVYVMFHGEVRRELGRSDLSEENIMVAATGGTI